MWVFLTNFKVNIKRINTFFKNFLTYLVNIIFPISILHFLVLLLTSITNTILYPKKEITFCQKTILIEFKPNLLNLPTYPQNVMNAYYIWFKLRRFIISQLFFCKYYFTFNRLSHAVWTFTEIFIKSLEIADLRI